MNPSGYLTAWILGAICSSAQAASYSWEAVEAVNDAYYGPDNDHALWMVGLAGSGHARDWLFDSDSGRFSYDDTTGVASLSGSLVNEIHASLSGDILFNFQHNPLGGKPKQELIARAYAQNHGPVDTSTWRYFDNVDGSFTGTGTLAGLTIAYGQRPGFDPDDPDRHRGQLGIGASGKNIDFGFSSWFYWSVTGCSDGSGYNGCAPLGLSVGRNDIGDININLVPIPAACWLFGSVMFALIGWRRQTGSPRRPARQAPIEIAA